MKNQGSAFLYLNNCGLIEKTSYEIEIHVMSIMNGIRFDRIIWFDLMNANVCSGID